MKNKDTAKILIVDDQIHALHGVARIMRRAGYETFEASTGTDCLKLAVEQKPDLILLDIVLPDIDGREVCQRIKSDPETADIYVVLLTSIHVESDSQAEGLEHGADGYITRPIPNMELLARVKAILRLKYAERRLREIVEKHKTAKHELEVHQAELEMQNEELKRFQLALETSRDEFQDLYDFAPVGYFTLTKKGLITQANLTGASLLGAPRSKLAKMSFGDFVASESEDQWHLHIVSVLKDEQKHTIDLRLKCEYGSSFYAHIESIRMSAPTATQVAGDGMHVIRVAISDITEIKKSEESLREAAAFLNTILDAIQSRYSTRTQMAATSVLTNRTRSSSARPTRSLSVGVCLTSPRGTWQKHTTQRISNFFIIQALMSMTPKSRTPVGLFTMWFSTSPRSRTPVVMFSV